MELELDAADLGELWGRNQYLVEFKQLVGENASKLDFMNVFRLLRAREEMLDEFGFAIPNAPALQLIEGFTTF